jgi:hypothetical protein
VGYKECNGNLETYFEVKFLCVTRNTKNYDNFSADNQSVGRELNRGLQNTKQFSVNGDREAIKQRETSEQAAMFKQ